MAAGHAFLYTAVAFWLLTAGGNGACRQLFALTGMKDAIAPAISSHYSAGRIIGWLERLVLAIGIVTRSWEVLAAVVALKTVARFKELDDQLNAEYFLIGSLFSVLWAISVTSAWLAYDHLVGIGLARTIALTLAPATAT
jgi:hypothetical protein